MLRWFLPAFVAVSSAHAVEDPDPPPPRAYHAGMMLLTQGKYSRAEGVFRQAIDEQPEHPRPRFGLGIALARQRRCAEAAEQFDSLRTWWFFSADGFLAEGECAQREGDRAFAVDRFEMAVERRPRRADALYGLVLSQVEFDDVEAAAPILDRLEDLDEGSFFEIASAHAALGTSDFEGRLAMLGRSFRVSNDRQARAQHAVLEGRADMLAGDPCRAAAAMLPALRLFIRHSEFASWRAEAFRRCGDTGRGSFAIDRDPIANRPSIPLLLAVKARLLVDQDELAEAREILALHPDPTHPEYLASAWYLARASGEPTEPLETAYEIVRRVSDGDLSLLVPMEYP